MKTESEINRENALELSRLILENPTMRVIAWISSDGICDDYSDYSGDFGKPGIQTIAYSEANEHYIEKDGDDYEDCYSYYGDYVDDWTDEELKQKAAEIPWEDVIAVRVSVC